MGTGFTPGLREPHTTRVCLCLSLWRAQSSPGRNRLSQSSRLSFNLLSQPRVGGVEVGRGGGDAQGKDPANQKPPIELLAPVVTVWF